MSRKVSKVSNDEFDNEIILQMGANPVHHKGMRFSRHRQQAMKNLGEEWAKKGQDEIDGPNHEAIGRIADT